MAILIGNKILNAILEKDHASLVIAKDAITEVPDLDYDAIADRLVILSQLIRHRNW